MSLMLASYNIHRCYGRDGHYAPSRIRQVLHELDAQVVALQEVELLREAPDLLDYFCENTSWEIIHGPTLRRDTGHYGNALLTSLPVESVERIDLSQSGREPRGALHVRLRYEDSLLEVIATHLGLRPEERRTQVRQLLGVLQDSEDSRTDTDITVLMGDLNEWFLWGRPQRWLRAHFQNSPAVASYPACHPLFALDRIWIKPRKKLADITVMNNKLTRAASDHLPLIAQLE